MRIETDYEKIRRLSMAIADGMDGMEGKLFQQAKSDLLNYYYGLMLWLQGQAVKMSETDSMICVRMGRDRTFARLLGSTNVPITLEA